MKFNFRSFAKAIVGPVLGLLGALGVWAATGHLDQHSLLVFGGGLVAGVITYFVPNAAPEVQAAEDVLFNPVAAGHPSPDPEPPRLAAVPEPAASALEPAPAAPVPPTPPAA